MVIYHASHQGIWPLVALGLPWLRVRARNP